MTRARPASLYAAVPAAIAFFACCATALAPLAHADEIVLRADPSPIIEVTINKQPVRLEVDTRAPDILILNGADAKTLGLRSVPFTRVAVAIDNAKIQGRVARPNIRFPNSEKDRSFAVYFDHPVTTRAQGIIGPGALPYDKITIILGDPPGLPMRPPASGDPVPPRTRTFALKDPDVWRFRAPIAADVASEVRPFVLFDAINPDIIFNRPAVRELERFGLIKPEGELAARPWVLGLAPRMQPVTLDPALGLEGRSLGASGFARTNQPVRAPDDTTVVVTAKEDGDRDPGVILGRAMLEGCYSMTVDRKARTLELVCAQ